MTNKATESSSKIISIYKVTNKVNSKCYIGQTCNSVALRFSQHWYDAQTNKKKNVFHSALRKYGKDAFSYETILICNADMANFYEDAVMNLYGAHASKGNGYNSAMPLDHFRSIATSAYCDSHGNAKLTNEQAAQIRQDVNLSTGDAAKKYNVSTTTIKKIRYGDSWAKLDVSQLPVGSYKRNTRKGESHHASILSDNVRSLIKNDDKTNTKVLADKYGIHPSMVNAIRGAMPHIAKLRVISDNVAQYVLDNPESSNALLSKELGISVATISRIKTGKQFPHLVSKASKEQWDIFFLKQKRATGQLKD